MPILDLLLALLYPPRCASCARHLRRVSGSEPCRRCLSRLVPLAPGCGRCAEPGVQPLCARCAASPPPFRTARACFRYGEGDLVADLLLRWKYQRDHVVGSSLCSALRAHRQRRPECYDVVVPVPLHASRLAARGFNQAVLLARAARRQGEQLLVDALRRRVASSSQTRLGRRQRLDSVAAAFVATPSARLRGRSVLLVDDVLTTGATAGACAAALLGAGATSVDVWTLARTPAPRPAAAPQPAVRTREEART